MWGSVVVLVASAALTCGCDSQAQACAQSSAPITYDCSGADPDAGTCDGGPTFGGMHSDDQPHAVGCFTKLPSSCITCICAAVGPADSGAQWECPL